MSKREDEQAAAEFYKKYDLAAKKEGWLITNDSDGLLRIAKVDDPIAWIDDGWDLDYRIPKFEYDEDAIAFVEERAAENSEWHAEALRIHHADVWHYCS